MSVLAVTRSSLSTTTVITLNYSADYGVLVSYDFLVIYHVVDDVRVLDFESRSVVLFTSSDDGSNRSFSVFGSFSNVSTRRNYAGLKVRFVRFEFARSCEASLSSANSSTSSNVAVDLSLNSRFFRLLYLYLI